MANDSDIEDDSNNTYVQRLVISTENCTDESMFIRSAILSVETWGYLAFDFEYLDYLNDNDTSSNNTNNNVTQPCSLPSNPIPYADPDMVNSTTNSSYWFPIVLTPTIFNVTILSNDTDIFYSYSNDTCMPILDYWENDTLGCPCNDGWNVTGYYDTASNSFKGGREIIPSLCTQNSCPESFFLNDTQKYANLRLNVTVYDNGTVLRTIEITNMSTCPEIGYTYDADDIAYSFTWERPIQ
jgi:hypothetical protein